MQNASTTSSPQQHLVRHRTPRFVRKALDSRVAITDRDLEMFAHLERSRFLRGTQLARLVKPDAELCERCKGRGRSDAIPHCLPCAGTGVLGHKTVLERIGRLYAAGYLDRPPYQKEYFAGGLGSQRLVYALSNDGYRTLLAHGAGSPVGRIDISARNAEATRRFIHHTLDTADLAIAIELAARRRADVNLLMNDDLAATLPSPARDAQLPFKVSATLRHQGTTQLSAVVPDLAFALRIDQPSSRRARSYAFLCEVDRGTMPIERWTMKQTSLVRKFITYETARTAGVAQDRFDWTGFRVPIVTTSAKRIDAIVKSLRSNPVLRGSPLFLMTTLEALRSAPDILAHEWMTASGTATLLPR